MEHKKLKLRKLEFAGDIYRSVVIRAILLLGGTSDAELPPVKPPGMTSGFKLKNLLSRQRRVKRSVFTQRILLSAFPGRHGGLRKMYCRRLERWGCVNGLISGCVFLATLAAVAVPAYLLWRWFPAIRVMIYNVFMDSAVAGIIGFLQLLGYFVSAAVLYIVLLAIAARLAYVVINFFTLKRFADAVCTLNAAFIVLALMQDDVLVHPAKKKDLLGRLDHLAQNTIALSAHYGMTSDEERDWSFEHFRLISRYIRERERWIVAPQETTLADVRRDFNKLAGMYFNKSYGDFKWDSVTVPEVEQKGSAWGTVFGVVSKFALISLPVILYIVMTLQKLDTDAFGIKPDLAKILLLGWFVLAIDSGLKLGVVSGALNFAKEIRGIK